MRGRRLLVKRWKQLRRLSGPERWLLAQAAMLLPATALGLALFGLRRCQVALAGVARACQPPAQIPGVEQLPRAQAVARLVAIAVRHGVSRTSCLPQALVLRWLLCRHGIAAELRIGVRKNGSRLQAHAWVECQGLVVSDRADVRNRFAVFDRPVDATAVLLQGAAAVEPSTGSPQVITAS